MIGFLLGQNLTEKKLRDLGQVVLVTSLSVVVMTAVMVCGVLVLFGARLEVALLLGGIATATAPAASMDVVHEYRAKGKFTDTLLGIVAIDDAWALLIFTLLLAGVQTIRGHNGFDELLLTGLWELGGAVMLGAFLGLTMAYLTGRVRPGEPSQAEAIGVVMLAAGIAEWMEVSYILSAIVLGAMVANLARHHTRPFHAIEGIEWPFLILFFLLAGAALRVGALAQAGLLAVGYIVLRVAGRLLGAQLGGRLSRMSPSSRCWMGLALLPQAGVAIGMALMASQRFPELKDVILPVVLASTVVFEIFGPVATRWSLVKVGDIHTNHRDKPEQS